MPLQLFPAAALFAVAVAAPVPRGALAPPELVLRSARATDAGTWMRVRLASLPGRNDQTLTEVSLDRCKAACIDRPSCKSFDYGPNIKRCLLSDSTAGQDGAPDLVKSTTYGHYAIPARMATPVLWVRAKLQALPGRNDQTLTDVSLESCKAACIARRSCKSLDYGPNIKRCLLSDSTAGQDGAPDLVKSTRYGHYALTRGSTGNTPAPKQCGSESASPRFTFGSGSPGPRSARSSSKRDTCVRSVGQNDYVGTAKDTLLETAIARSDETASGLLQELAGADGLKRYAGTAGSLFSGAGLGFGWGVTQLLSETGIMGVDDPKVLALEDHADCVSGQIKALWEALDETVESMKDYSDSRLADTTAHLEVISATTGMKAISSTLQGELMEPLSWCLAVDEGRDTWAVSNSAKFCTDAVEYFSMLNVLSSQSAALRHNMEGMVSKLEFIREEVAGRFHWGLERPVSRSYHSITPGITPPAAIDFADTRQIVVNLNGLSEQAMETFGLLKTAMKLRLARELHNEPGLKEHLEEWVQKTEKTFYGDLAATLGHLGKTLDDQAFVAGRTARSDRFREKMICANPMHLEDVWGKVSSKRRPDWCTPSKTEFVHRWLSAGEGAGLFECVGTATAADRYEAKLKEYCDACVDWDLIRDLGLDLDQSSCENPEHTMWCSTSDVPAVYAPSKAVRNTPKDPGCPQFNRRFQCEEDEGWDPSDRWVKADEASDCASLCTDRPAQKKNGHGELEDTYFRQCSGHIFFPSMKACYLKPRKSASEDLNTYGPGFDGSGRLSTQSSKGAFGPLPDNFGFEQIKNQFYSWPGSSARAEPIDPLAIERVLLHRTLDILDALASGTS